MARVSTCTVASVRVNVILVTGERSNTLALAARITAAAMPWPARSSRRLAGASPPVDLGRRRLGEVAAGQSAGLEPGRLAGDGVALPTPHRRVEQTQDRSRLVLDQRFGLPEPRDIAGPAAATELISVRATRRPCIDSSAR